MKLHLIEKIHKAIKGKKHIIWDWNGTLLNDVDHAVSVVNALLVDHQLPLIDKETYRKSFKFPVINYYKNLGFNFEKESFEDLCHRFVEKFMTGVQELPLIPEMKTVILQLHSEKITQSVLSATDQLNLDSMISHFNLSNIFRFVFGLENKFAHSKIERGQELLTQSQFDKQDTVIIGDTLHDLDVGNALGIDTVLISHGHQCAKRLHLRHKNVIEI